MSNLNLKTSISNIYRITGYTAFIYSGLLVIFATYIHFFYMEKTLAHSFITIGFAIIAGIIWLGILYIFKRFLNKVLNYYRANKLINLFLILIVIDVFLHVMLFISSVKLYRSLEDLATFGSITNYASSFILIAIIGIISTVGMIFTSLALGNRLRKIDVVEKNLFIALGLSFIVYGIFFMLHSLTIIENDTIPLVLKAVMVSILGYILKKASSMDASAFPSSLELETASPEYIPKAKSFSEVPVRKKGERAGITNIKDKLTPGIRKKEIKQELEEVPIVNLDQLENKELVLSYYKNLSKEEISRLQFIVSKKYHQDLNEEQLSNLVILHIAENKLYDHQRYGPK